jgi:signal transduction histidine kinase
MQQLAPHPNSQGTSVVTRILIPVLVLLLGLFHGQNARATTPEQAKAMAEKAAEYVKQHGPEKAFAAIEDRSGQFRDGDLYVFVHDSAGLVVAHGGYASLKGKNTIGLTDIDGKPFVKEMVAIKDTGWVDYKWQNPVSKALEEKSVYVIRVGPYLVCAGAYKRG